MKGKVEKCDYSDNETLIKAIELIKKGNSEEDVQKRMNLSNEDMDLIDFVINEL
ncbi:hypothetical protein [Peribacillus saganii]|uniref:hypothetical protein n=1 Tax=Peribacillus saganii TaxID=2303992 RepID=UPI0013140181|nr:hypothetical protein [Peribacillus saganii]